MKRKTNTLDAEYKRRGLIRPTQATKGVAVKTEFTSSYVMVNGRKAAKVSGHLVEWFDWKGTTVWGVKA